MSNNTSQYSKLKALPADERPRERLLRHGAEALSSVELIAILLGSGMQGKSVLILAQELLAHFGSLRHLLQASLEDLCLVKGLGMAKATKLKASFSLATRANREKELITDKLDTPLKAYLWVRDYVEYQINEVLGVILLNAQSRVIRWEVVAVGTLNRVFVHSRDIFRSAIKYSAASLIVVHNHPSGDPTPSMQDKILTHQLVRASCSVRIPLIDHLIIGKGDFISLKEKGFPFDSLSSEGTCAEAS
jgi:DNA repair protein RadC